MTDPKFSDEEIKEFASDFERYLTVRRRTDVHYDIQEVRIRTEARFRQMPKDFQEYGKGLRKLEASLKNKVQKSLNGIPIYNKFFSRVYGVGPLISGWIVGKTMIRFAKISKSDFQKAVDYLDAPDEVRAEMEIKDFLRLSRSQVDLAQKTKDGNYLYPTIRGIGAFDTVSKYWKWWGLHVTEEGRRPRRKRGETLEYDSSLRMFSSRIGTSFKRLGKFKKTGLPTFYNRIYTSYKRRLFDNPRMVKIKGKKVLSPAFKDIIETPKICPYYTDQYCSKGPCKGHLDDMAISYAVKVFLSHVWEQWRILEGLPVRQPYALEKLGHRTYIDWEPDRE